MTHAVTFKLICPECGHPVCNHDLYGCWNVEDLICACGLTELQAHKLAQRYAVNNCTVVFGNKISDAIESASEIGEELKPIINGILDEYSNAIKSIFERSDK